MPQAQPPADLLALQRLVARRAGREATEKTDALDSTQHQGAANSAEANQVIAGQSAAALLSKPADAQAAGAPARSAVPAVQREQQPESEYQSEDNILGGIYEPVPGRELRIVAFDIASDKIPPAALPALDALAAYLQQLAGDPVTVKLIGTASNSRVQKIDNTSLGLARAEAVKAYLIQAGVPAELLSTSSTGSVNAPPASAGSAVKADARSVGIKIEYGPVPPAAYGGPSAPPDSLAGNQDLQVAFDILKTHYAAAKAALSGLKLLDKPSLKGARKFGKALEGVVKAGSNLNNRLRENAEKHEVYVRFTSGFAKALADLTAENVSTVEVAAAAGNSELGPRAAYEFRSALGEERFKKFAAEWRSRYPNHRQRAEVFFLQFKDLESYVPEIATSTAGEAKPAGE